jgi:galactokinase
MTTASSTVHLGDLLDRAVNLFRMRFRRPPMWAAVAPGRINLIGEHTDYNLGFALPMAIDRHTVIVAGPTAAKKSMLLAPDIGESVRVDLTGDFDPIKKQFANYLIGVTYQYWLAHADISNMNVVVTSSIPIGSGLSSSAAMCVAMTYVLEQMSKLELDPATRAAVCRQAEWDFAQTPCGIMDILTSIRAEAGAALLIDCSNDRCQVVPMPGADKLAVVVIDTGVRHDLSSGEYASRRTTCEQAAAKLGVVSLRDASSAMIEACGDLSSDEYRCAQHVAQENKRVLLAAAAMREGRLEQLGDLMFAGHDSLRDLFRVSCPELDAAVDYARRMRERGRVYGARLTGGGFGGSAVVLCPPEAARDVGEEVRNMLYRECGCDATALHVRSCAGAYSVDVPAVIDR